MHALIHQYILEAAALILSAIGSFAAVGLKNFIANQKNIMVKMLVEKLVGYAEQKLTTDMQAKYSYVAQEVSKKFPEFTSVEIEQLIESEVAKLPSSHPAVVPDKIN